MSPSLSFDIPNDIACNIFISMVAVYWLIITPIQIYWGYQFWKLKQQNVAFFTKRHPSLVIFNAIMFNLYPLIFRPIFDTLVLNNVFPMHHPAALIFGSSGNPFGVLLVMRLWLFYYDFSSELHSLSLKWKSQITKSNHDDQDHGNQSDLTHIKLPWTMRYRWMGNPAKISILGIPVAMSILLISVLSTYSLHT